MSFWLPQGTVSRNVDTLRPQGLNLHQDLRTRWSSHRGRRQAPRCQEAGINMLMIDLWIGNCNLHTGMLYMVN